MAYKEPADSHQSQLKRIKREVEKAYQYFKPNYDRFNNFRRFVYDTTLDATSIALLKTLKKPQIEFNICEAYISRLIGEFSKQEPSIEVHAGDEKPVDLQVIDVVQGHFKHLLDDANQQGFEHCIYKDSLSGGFSVAKVSTDYANEMSFNQVIKIERAYDPILCGFDPMARLPHKGDGRFCFELFPKTKDEFEEEYPDINIDTVKFLRDMEGFSWAYRNQRDNIILICDFWEKKMKRKKIVRLSNGHAYTLEQYKKDLKRHEEMGRIEVPPTIVEERMSEIETVCRYRIIQDRVIEYVETDYKMLPLIFFDGNSILIREETAATIQQMTRPYIYNAKGTQLLKNFAGQTLANELENLVQHKFMVAKEALPNEEDYLDAYRNVQQADVLVYNYLDPNRQDVTLPPPGIVPRVNIPPELSSTFIGTDQMMQTILGNFDMDLGKVNQSQVSGIAVQESITQSNAAAMPYIVGFLQGLTRIAEIVVDLIPKYYVTPRSVPVVDRQGKRKSVPVNGKTSNIHLDYEPSSLNVRVEAGVNFSVQKSRALAQIIALMQASPLFAQFMNTEGLPILLDNIEIKGIEGIKQQAEAWAQQMKQMQAQQMKQQANMPNPDMLKAQIEQQKLQQNAQKMQYEMQEHDRQFAIDHDRLQLDKQKLAVEAHEAGLAGSVQTLKAHTEQFSKMADMKMHHEDQQHRHVSESIDMAHKHHVERHGIHLDHLKLEHEKEKAKHERASKNPGTSKK